MVDIVIPTYNNYTQLKTCLMALCHQTIQDFEAWIVVDGSSDETLLNLPQFILQLPFKAHILEHSDKQNHGRSAVRNLALAYVKKPFVWFLDSDMIPEPNCLENHLSICTQYQNSVSVGAIHYQNTEENIWAKYISTRGHAKYNHKELLPWNYFITANSLIPTVYFTQIHGFDENITKYGGDDTEFAYRMYLNFTPYFYKNDLAVCKSIEDKTLFKALIQMEEHGREVLSYVYQKHTNMPKIYRLDKLEGSKIKKAFYTMLTLPIWAKCIKGFVHFLPFGINKHLINYLVISAVFNGYRKQSKTG